jgi:hypothetical protein
MALVLNTPPSCDHVRLVGAYGTPQYVVVDNGTPWTLEAAAAEALRLNTNAGGGRVFFCQRGQERELLDVFTKTQAAPAGKWYAEVIASGKEPVYYSSSREGADLPKLCEVLSIAHNGVFKGSLRLVEANGHTTSHVYGKVLCGSQRIATELLKSKWRRWDGGVLHGIPTAPEYVYRATMEWKGWGDFLGNGQEWGHRDDIESQAFHELSETLIDTGYGCMRSFGKQGDVITVDLSHVNQYGHGNIGALVTKGVKCYEDHFRDFLTPDQKFKVNLIPPVSMPACLLNRYLSNMGAQTLTFDLIL